MKMWIASFDRIVHLCCSCLYLGGERCHGWCVYMPQTGSQHTPRYVLRSPRLWVKTTNEKYICVLIFIWWMLAGTSGLCEPSSLETNFISGHVQYGFDKKRLHGRLQLAVQYHVYEQINIVHRDSVFRVEKCRWKSNGLGWTVSKVKLNVHQKVHEGDQSLWKEKRNQQLCVCVYNVCYKSVQIWMDYFAGENASNRLSIKVWQHVVLLRPYLQDWGCRRTLEGEWCAVGWKWF